MTVPQITPAQLAAKLAGPELQRPSLVDVRTAEEHDYVALPDSLLLPLNELEEREEEIAALRGKEVVVYCHHGVRSLDGAAFLRDRGVDASSLAGGIERYAVQIDPCLRRY